MNNTVPVNNDFETILISAVRYALGRQTYVVSTTVEYIKPLIPKLSDTTLYVMERDIRDAKNKGSLEIDEPEWNTLHKLLRAEMIVRGFVFES